jgi:hypothetical protein
MAKPERVPSFFILVPGPWRAPPDVTHALIENGIPGDWIETTLRTIGNLRVDVVEDERLAAGFKWGRQGPLDSELVARVAGCSHAALIEFGGRLHEHAPRLARVGRALRDAGGAAVRMEASGAASSWEPWLERLESNHLFRIYQSAVIMVQGDGSTTFTCGMHHFDLPDAQIAMHDSRKAIEWLDEFCVYQLAEQPALASGHTFRPNMESERRHFDRWPDERHRREDGRHNPFGLWRFREPGVAGAQATKLVPTFVPSLVAVLTAAERTAGRALSRPEVEAILNQSAIIALEVRDAMAMERGRGYADIEPELAWEQWQIVRSMN